MTIRFARILAAAALAAAALSPFPLQSAAAAPQAATITVNTETDVSTDDGLCSLREAVWSANYDFPSGELAGECAGGSGPDTIHLPAGTFILTVPGADEDQNGNGDLDLTSDITLQGAGAGRTFLQAGSDPDTAIDRVLDIHPGADLVALRDLTVRYGKTPGTGGGINVANATLALRGVEVADNTAGLSGGGIYIFHPDISALHILGSSILRNQSGGTGGGGIYAHTAALDLANTTLAGNSTTGDGGGLSTRPTGASLTHVTITGNTAEGQGGGLGVRASSAPTGLQLGNSVLAGNTAAGGEADCSGAIESAGHNFIGDNTGCEAAFPPGEPNPNADFAGTAGAPLEPGLGTLAGAPAAHRLPAASPLVDQVPVAACVYLSSGDNPLFSNLAPVDLDQLGVHRPFGAACDIGARERADLAVNTTADVVADDGACSLREALTAAARFAPSGSLAGECPPGDDPLVQIPAGVYPLALPGPGEDGNATGDLDLQVDLTLQGAGADSTFVQAGPNTAAGLDRVLHILPGVEAAITGLTFRYGKTSGAGGGILMEGTALYLASCQIASSMAGGDGGGVAFGGGSDLTIAACAILDNTAGEDGGGIAFNGTGQLTIQNSTLAGNRATSSGGGLSSAGPADLTHVTITANAVEPYGIGGGIALQPGGPASLTAVALAGNTVGASGEGPDCFASSDPYSGFTSGGFNLIGNGDGCSGDFIPSDLVGTAGAPIDPLLGPRAGSPAYYAPRWGSPLIDRIPAGDMTLAEDQRGEPRPQDGDLDGEARGDTGAIEVAFTRPIAVDDTATTTEDAPVEIGVLANDSDPDGSLDPASVTVASGPSFGTVQVNPTGTITYTPAPYAEYTDTDSFTYTVADNDGVPSLPATVTINITASPVPPNAAPDTAATQQDTPVEISVLDNDTDPDGALDPASLTVTVPPANGSIQVNPNGTLTYTPAPGYTGEDTFTYTVKDATGLLSNPAEVTVTITPLVITGDEDTLYLPVLWKPQ